MTLAGTFVDVATLLRQYSLGETSVICVWLTQNHGIVRAVAKSAKSPKSPFAGQIDLFYHCQVEWVSARKGDLHHLKSVRVLQSRDGIRRNYHSLSLAGYYIMLLVKVLEDGVAVPEYFSLLTRALDFLHQRTPTWRALTYFEEQVALLLGIYLQGMSANALLKNHLGSLPHNRSMLEDALRG